MYSHMRVLSQLKESKCLFYYIYTERIELTSDCESIIAYLDKLQASKVQYLDSPSVSWLINFN